MKKTIITICLGLLMFGGTNELNAQSKAKFGHINMNDLLLLMPQRDSAEQSLTVFAQQLESQLESMSLEYEKLVGDYQANLATMSEPVKELKASEIGDLEKRIRDFQTKAQGSLGQKEQSLMEPLIEKANSAINKVAEDNGFTYVFDTSAGMLIKFPEGDDLLPLVKKQLGLE